MTQATLACNLPKAGGSRVLSQCVVCCWLLISALADPFAVPVAAAAESKGPNVVLILADDLGYADVGFQGAKDIPTPHLDRLAAEGVRCTNGYSAHPFCSPMRASLMTGRYQHRFGYERNIAYDTQNRWMGLPQRETTIATRMQQQGYATGMVGKWHLGAALPFHPKRRGFDFFYGFLGGGHNYFEVDLLKPTGEGYFEPLQRNGRPEILEDYLTTVLSQEAVQFIQSHRSEPFFLYVAYNAPHTPMQAPQELLEQFRSISDPKRRAYAAMVRSMDEGIGSILQCLEELQLRDKTLVMFLSDNGGPERANGSCNDPLRGQKGDLYEGGIRVPFVAQWPGTLPAGATFHHPVQSMDLVCTALAVAGGRVDDGRLEGKNLIPHWCGKESQPPHGALFWRKENGQQWAVRAGDWKLVQLARGGPGQLYNLASDTAEETNLAESHPDQVQRLSKLYEQWNQSNQPPFFPSYGQYHEILNEHYRAISQAGAAAD